MMSIASLRRSNLILPATVATIAATVLLPGLLCLLAINAGLVRFAPRAGSR